MGRYGEIWGDMGRYGAVRERSTLLLTALDDGNLSSVERYDPAVGAWEAVAPMAAARSAPAVAALEGKLYAAGGSDNNGVRLSSVERYDPATNAWEAVTPMAAARAASHGGARRQAVRCWRER